MKATRIALLLVSSAQPLFANQPPGPAIALPAILILPLMMLLTAIGGGYAVMKRLRTGSWRTGLKAAAVLGLFLFVMIILGSNEVGWFLMLVIFGVVAIWRGIRLTWWGSRAASINPRPPYLEAVSPPRAIGTGVGLVLMTVVLVVIGAAFVGSSPSPDDDRLAALREYVALQKLWMTLPAEEKLFLDKKVQVAQESAIAQMCNHSDNYSRANGKVRGYQMRIDESEADGGFTVYLLPNVRRTPSAPFNRMVSMPTYRADESGLIRMQRVHSRDAVCAPDAPVVDRVGARDIEAVRRAISP